MTLPAIYSNPFFSVADKSMIDLTVASERLGIIPTTITAEEHPDLWKDAFPIAAPYVYPPQLTAAEVLEQDRSMAYMSRAEFLQAVLRAGIFTKAEAVDASTTVPTFFLNALTALVTAQSMTQSDADGAEILWLNLSEVRRNHPYLPIAQKALGLSDAKVDALFGIGTRQ